MSTKSELKKFVAEWCCDYSFSSTDTVEAYSKISGIMGWNITEDDLDAVKALYDKYSKAEHDKFMRDRALDSIVRPI